MPLKDGSARATATAMPHTVMRNSNMRSSSLPALPPALNLHSFSNLHLKGRTILRVKSQKAIKCGRTRTLHACYRNEAEFLPKLPLKGHFPLFPIMLMLFHLLPPFSLFYLSGIQTFGNSSITAEPRLSLRLECFQILLVPLGNAYCIQGFEKI